MINDDTTLTEIRDMLDEDGFETSLKGRADEIKRAASNGCLMWTRSGLHKAARIRTTDASRIDETGTC